MIRRGFWLTVGAAAGIVGYRRVSAVGRRLSASLDPGTAAALASGSKTLARGGRLTARGAASLATETFRFARDVREGMEQYTAAHSAPAGSTTLATNHDLRPKDGR